MFRNTEYQNYREGYQYPPPLKKTQFSGSYMKRFTICVILDA